MTEKIRDSLDDLRLSKRFLALAYTATTGSRSRVLIRYDDIN